MRGVFAALGVLVACGDNAQPSHDDAHVKDDARVNDSATPTCTLATTCDDQDACTIDVCAEGSCVNESVLACSEPGTEAFCKFPDTCARVNGVSLDTDGDGLSNAWEVAGGIDADCDGTVTTDERVLTNVDLTLPDGTTNPTPSADPNVIDVFVRYDWMELADQLTNGIPTPCTVNTLSPPNNIFYPYHSNACAWDQLCMGGVCKGHSDEPAAPALQQVVDAFARRGIRLHLVRGHPLPHANTIVFGPPIAACVAERAGDTFLGAQTANFYTIKANEFPANLAPAFHYAIFAHRHTCDSPVDCAKLACANPDTGRQPVFNETGVAEQPGNDIIVTFGGARDRNLAPTTIAGGGTFMHELGHNLGLDHGGPIFVGGVPNDVALVRLNFKPNYVSVMNYNHQTIGIATAATVGGVTPIATRIDYASFTGQPPNTLDETMGDEAAGIGLGTIAMPNNDIGYTWCNGTQTAIPGTGPVDFNCTGGAPQTWCSTTCDITPALELNKDPAGGGSVGGDRLVPFEDWPNLLYAFQCSATYND